MLPALPSPPRARVAYQRCALRVALHPCPAVQLRVRVAVLPRGPTVLRVAVQLPSAQLRVCVVAPP